MGNELTLVQHKYGEIVKSQGFESFEKIYTISGYSSEDAAQLAKKEALHLAQLMTDSEALKEIPAHALVQEMKKLPMMGLSLDPSLKLAYLIISDKKKGRVSLEPSARGMVVQAIDQGVIENISVEVIYDGDATTTTPSGLIKIVPCFNNTTAKVIGAIVNIYYNGRPEPEQKPYRSSHIDIWRKASEKKFFGKANLNYTSHNGGISPGFMESKCLKHTLSKMGINPLPQKRTSERALDVSRAVSTSDGSGGQVFDLSEYPDKANEQTTPANVENKKETPTTTATELSKPVITTNEQGQIVEDYTGDFDPNNL